MIGHLAVGRLDQSEADRTVQLDGGRILGGRLQANAFHPAVAESAQPLQDQGASESQSAMLWSDPDVLH